MIVTCDKCRMQFYSMLKEDTKEIEGRLITRTYFECPHCGQQYNICYDDRSTLVLKKQIRRQTEELGTIRDENKYWNKKQNIKRRQKRLEKEMELLQKKYEKYFILVS